MKKAVQVKVFSGFEIFSPKGIPAEQGHEQELFFKSFS